MLKAIHNKQGNFAVSYNSSIYFYLVQVGLQG